MLSIVPLRTTDPAHYYLEALSVGAEEYYLRRDDLPGRWLGRAAVGLGLSGVVDPDDLRALLAGTRPDGSDLRDTWVLRPGYDATFSAPKSVSVLWALGDRETARAVIAAHDAAVDDALTYLERHGCRVRRGGLHGHGVRFHHGGGMVAAAFRHLTSREGDPQLHSHVLIANATSGPDGRWTGIDSKGLYAHARSATALYQAVLRRRLAEVLGLSFEVTGDGTGNVAGIPDAVLRRFSKRRVAIEKHMREHGTSGAKAAQVATLATRKAKEHGVCELDLRIRWLQEADELGFDPASVPRWLGRPLAGLSTDEEVGGVVTLDDATFDRAKVAWVLAANAVDGAELAEIEQRTEEFLTSLLVVDLGEKLWTTTEMLAIEERVLALALDGRRAGFGQVDEDAVSGALAVRPSLSEEQVAMVRRICASGDPIDTVSARRARARPSPSTPPGQRGRRVATTFSVVLSLRGPLVACSPDRGSAVAPSTGSSSTSRSARSDSAASRSPWSMRLRWWGPGSWPAWPMPARAPEPSWSSSATRSSCRPSRPAVCSRPLANRLGGVQLTGNRRQQNPEERQVVADLRDGQVRRAIDRLNRIGGIALFRNADHLVDAMVEEWLAATRSGQDAVMLALTRDATAELNARARQRISAKGGLGPVVAQVGEVEFAVGDRVVCTRNNKKIGVVNGDAGIVEGAGEEGLTIRLDGRLVELPAAYLATGNLTHGYALTVHKAQGATCDVILLWGTESLHAEAGYTALTRGRIRNRSFVLSEGGIAEHLPAERREPIQLLANRLSASAMRPAAINARTLG